MKISLLCNNLEHPVMPWLRDWKLQKEEEGHSVTLCADRSELLGGDLLFLVSCSQIIRDRERALYAATLVVHASDLPRGRGWSPHVWQIIEGASRITVALIEARDPVDTGDVWLKTTFELQGTELLPEINERLFVAEFDLMDRAVREWGSLVPQPQVGDPGAYRSRRTPEHSRLDPSRTIAEQFDQLRVVDNERYPAFFDHRGARYVLKIERATE